MFSTYECHPTAQRAHPQHHQLAWCHLHVLSHQSWFWISVLVHLSIPAPFSLSCAPCLPSSPWPPVPVSHGRVSPRQEHPWCQHSHMFPGVPHPWMPAPACSHRGCHRQPALLRPSEHTPRRSLCRHHHHQGFPFSSSSASSCGGRGPSQPCTAWPCAVPSLFSSSSAPHIPEHLVLPFLAEGWLSV